MNNDLNIDVKTLNPFRRFIYTIGALPSSYLMSMTYEEQLIWLCNYLSETVIPALNNNGLAVEELQAKYIELKSYVDNYFEDLDIQEEINNKLDEMALDGTLENLIGQYIQLATTYVYNSVEEMKEATNLVNGSFARTSGFYDYDDGGGAYYKVREVLNTDIIDEMFIIALDDNTLVAELLPQKELNVLSIGCKNDGSEDCSANLIAALDKVKVLYFPRGTYIVDDTLELSNGFTIKGENMGTTMIITNADKPLIDITSKYFCKIEDIHLRGDNDWDNQATPYNTKTNQNLINVIGSNDCYFKNIYIDHAQANGVFIDESLSQTAIQINFENVYIKNNSKNGMYIGSVHGCKVDKGNCEYNGEYNMLIEKIPTDVSINSLNFNFNNKTTKAPLKIDCVNNSSNICINDLHIEDMSQETPGSHDVTDCLNIGAGMLEIGNLYVRYNASHYTNCMKIETNSHVSVHDCIFRQVNNPIIMPSSSGCMLRNIRTFDTTGTRISGRGANYEDNQVIKNTSTIIGSDGNVSQYVIGGIHLPRTYNFIYSAELFIPMGTAPSTGNIYLVVYNSSYTQLAYETIALSTFTNKKLDISSILSTLTDVKAIKIIMPQAVAAANVNVGITVDTV